MTLQFLNRFRDPYPSNFTAASTLVHGIGSGLFVVLFMVVAQPFGLASLAEEIRTVLYGGYGLITAGAIILSGLVVPLLFPRWCREENWTAGRFVLFAGGVMLLIGLASFEFTRRVFIAYELPLIHLGLTRVMAGTVLIGVFIIAVITLLDQNRLLRRNTRIGEAANARIGQGQGQPGAAPDTGTARAEARCAGSGQVVPPSDTPGDRPGRTGDDGSPMDGGEGPVKPDAVRFEPPTAAPTSASRRPAPPDDGARRRLDAASPASAGVAWPDVISLRVEDGRRDLRFRLDDLVCLSAEENYVEVRLQREKDPVLLVRSTLAGLEAQLAAFHPRLFRCHRTHLVNTAKIRNVSGNAQGLRLKLEGLDEPIPVSRRYVEEFRRLVLPML